MKKQCFAFIMILQFCIHVKFKLAFKIIFNIFVIKVQIMLNCIFIIFINNFIIFIITFIFIFITVVIIFNS